MMGVGKVGGGGGNYYVEAVAEGVDEYYRGIGEAPGQWAGRAAGGLGLEGEVDAEALRALWAGRHPVTGEKLGILRGRTVCGFDLTWKAPKSVSLLFGIGTPEVASVVRDAHDAAVDAAFGYTEANAFASRTGAGGAGQIAVEGVTAAKFRHRTSRAGDPHLHTHVLVANLAEGVDGKWRTLDGRLIYSHAKTAGYLYQAHLRHELTTRLGVEWGPVVNGCADLAGIDREVIVGFSDRRKEILEHLDDVGFRSARAAQLATLDTRSAKTTGDDVSMRDVWEAKAADLDFDPDDLDALTGRATKLELSDTAVAELFDHLVGPDGLTAQASTFDRRDVIEGIAGQLHAGATVEQIEAFADEFLARPDIVALVDHQGLVTSTVIRRADGKIIASPVANLRWSTADLIAIERRLVDTAVRRVAEGAGIVDPVIVARTLAVRPTLADEQREMIATLLRRGAGIEVVAAAAGTGKTFSLDAARDAWQTDGYQVLGAALSGRAAAELESSAAITSSTLAMLQINLDAGRIRFDDRTVLVIDEAGMAGTRTLAPILDAAARAGTKVVLVGDPRQLPEIDAGGVLAGLAARLDPIELVENRRQCEQWERDALSQLRSGDVDVAFDAYERNGRIVTADTAADVRTVMVADWWSYRIAGDNVTMLALRLSDVDDLNGLARAHRVRACEVTGPTLNVNDRPFQTGDEIICLHNDYKLGVRNSTRGTIESVDVDQRTLTMRSGKKTITLPAEYLDAGYIAHGYATTIHKAQGATVDRALLLGTDELFRERGYVGLSRGSVSNHLYMIGAREPDLAASHGPAPELGDPSELVRHALHRQDTQRLAIDSGTPIAGPTLEQLVAERRRFDTILRQCPLNPQTDLDALNRRRAEIERSLRPIVERRDQLADVRFKGRGGRAEMRTLDDRIAQLTGALVRLDDELARTGPAVAAHRRFVEQHREEYERRAAIESAIDNALADRVAGLADKPTPYLTERLGEVPTDPSPADSWARGATIIERWRVEHDITDDRHAFGLTENGRPYNGPFEVRLQLERIEREINLAPPIQMADVGLSR